MKYSSHIHQAIYPYLENIECGVFNYVPRTVSVIGRVMSGSSCGIGIEAVRGAYGEFVERNHFMLSLKAENSGSLVKHCAQELADSLASTINQVKGVAKDPLYFNWRLHLVKNLFTQKTCYYPFILLSLLNDNVNEQQMIPHMDSCGSAAHHSQETALQGATMEFLERQALVGAWLLGKAKRCFYPQAIAECSPYLQLSQQFLDNGDIEIYDLAHGFPGYAIVIIYFAKSKKDKVQYAIGGAYSLDVCSALTNALTELWQDYYYLYGADAFKEEMQQMPGSRYNFEHIADNTLETRALIPFSRESSYYEVSNYQQVAALPAARWSDVLASLKSISPHVFYYHYHDTMRNLHFARVVSHDFFLHMSVTDPLNIENAYSRFINLNLDEVTLQRIPFP